MSWTFIVLICVFGAAVWFLMRDQHAENKRIAENATIPERGREYPFTSLDREVANRGIYTPPVAKNDSKSIDEYGGDGTYSISYADVDGVVTERDISVLETYMSGSAIYIRAVCHLRDSERTFRADRILECFDGPGNRIEDPEVHFAGTLPLADRPDPEHDSVMSRVRPGLSALVWVAMADRDISTEEMEILLAYIGDRNAIGGARFAAVQWDRAKATAQIDQMRPTLADALAAVARMSPTGKDFALQRDYLARLVEAGGAASERRAKQIIKQI